MRATEFIFERKKAKRKGKKLRKYFFPGFAYYGITGSGEDYGGDGGGGEAESVNESPAMDLAKRLPSLKKHDYTTIDDLVREVAKKHRMSHKALNDLFTKKYKRTPRQWIKNKLDETSKDSIEKTDDLKSEIDSFVDWTRKRLNLKTHPIIELSMDTHDAQTNHHTGSHTEGDNKIWVYVKNRNLVDILRTVFHELVHVRQSELGMIKPGSSYPGSPIEAMADMLAGKYIKIYGKQNHRIFQ